jgi:hypothetical protein
MKTGTVDRQTLYDEVWAVPVTLVAARYGLSDVGLAKICRGMGIPLPARGYWAKLRAGANVSKTPLPPPRKDTQLTVTLHVRKVADVTDSMALKREAIVHAKAVEVDGAAPPVHPLVQAASRRLQQKAGWDSPKGLRSAPAEVLNIEVTAEEIERATNLANLVVQRLVSLGATVTVDGPSRRTIIDFRGAALPFSLTEYVRRTNHVITETEKKAIDRYNRDGERGIWRPNTYPSMPQYDWHPSGVLTLTLGSWPARSWKDTPRTRLELRLPEIISGIVVLAGEVCAKEAAEKRKACELAEAKERYKSTLERRQFEQETFDTLERNSIRWERATRIRAYVMAVAAVSQSQGDMTEELREWIAWARAKADWVDPLVSISDIVLDAPEPKKPGYWFDA